MLDLSSPQQKAAAGASAAAQAWPLQRSVSSKVRRPVRGSLHQHGHVARLVLIAAHQHMGGRDFGPGEHLGHAGIKAALDISLFAAEACARWAKWLPCKRFWCIHM
jgi:hypothetical protein